MSEGREGRNLKRREAMKKWKAVLAVFLSVVLVLQSSNIQALADVIDGDGETGREEIVLDKPAETTETSESTDEQKDTPPASEPKKEEPAEPAEPATPEEPAEKKDDSTKKDEPTQTTEPVEKAEETKPAEETEPAQTTEPSKETSSSTADKTSSPETEDTTATLKFDVTGATLTYNQDGEKNVTADTADKTAKVETTQDFKFTVLPDDGQQIAAVKAVTSDGAESDVTANESGEYTLPAANVTDGTTIRVTTEAVPTEEPAEDATPVESEETTESTEGAPMVPQTMSIRAVEWGDYDVSVQFINENEQTINPDGVQGIPSQLNGGTISQIAPKKLSGGDGTTYDFVGAYVGNNAIEFAGSRTTNEGRHIYYAAEAEGGIASLLGDGQTIVLRYQTHVDKHAITYNVTGIDNPEGLVSGATSVKTGESVDFTVVDVYGYTVQVSANNSPLTGNNGVYTLDNVTSDTTVNVAYTANTTYDFTVPDSVRNSANAHGMMGASTLPNQSNISVDNDLQFEIKTWIGADGSSVTGYYWLLNSLEINDQTISLPRSYTEGASATTTLDNGVVVRIELTKVTRRSETTGIWPWQKTHYAYEYTYSVTVSNAKEDVNLTRINFVGSQHHEVMPHFDSSAVSVRSEGGVTGEVINERPVQTTSGTVYFYLDIQPGYELKGVTLDGSTLPPVRWGEYQGAYEVNNTNTVVKHLDISTQPIAYSVQYVMNGVAGTAPTDETPYGLALEKNLVVADTPETDSGKVFLGWKLGDETYQPGTVLNIEEILEAADDNGRTITFTAQWGDSIEEGQPIPVNVDVYLQNEDGKYVKSNELSTTERAYGGDTVAVRDPESYLDGRTGYTLNDEKTDDYLVLDGIDTTLELYFDLPAIELTASNGGGVYSGEAYTLNNVKATVDGAEVEGVTIEYKVGDGKWTTTPPSATNVSESKSNISVRARKKGYVTNQIDGLSITVQRKNVTVAAVDASKTFGEEDPQFKADVNGVINGDVIAYSVTRPGAGTIESAGFYEDAIEVSGEKNQGNYSVSFVPGDFTIDPLAVDPDDPEAAVQVGQLADVPYTGQEQKQRPSVATKDGAALAEGTDYDLSWSGETTDVSEGGVTVTVSLKGNYSGTIERTYKILPAELKATIDTQVKDYDGDAKLELGDDAAVPASLDGVLGEDDVTATIPAGKVSFDSAAAGPRELVASAGDVQLSGEDAHNYKVVSASGSGRIDPLAVDPDDPEAAVQVGQLADVPYTGQEQKQRPSVATKDGAALAEGTDYDLSWSGETTDVSEGGVTVTVSLKGNYSGTIERTYKILPAELKATIDTQVKDYDGDAKLELGDDAAVPASLDGVLGEDDVTATIPAGKVSFDSAAAGPRELVASAGDVQLSGEDAHNYKVVSASGSGRIDPQSITPGPDPDNPDPSYNDVTVDYPENVPYDGTEHTWVPTVTDADGNVLVAKRDYTVSYSTTDRTNVTGTITVTITGTGNFAGTVTRTYQVVPRPLVVQANDQTKVQGAADPALSSGYNPAQLVAGEEPGWTGGLTREAGEAVGTYAITQGTLALEDNGDFLAANYVLTVLPGTLTITAAPAPDNPPATNDDGGDDTPTTPAGPTNPVPDDTLPVTEPTDDATTDDATPEETVTDDENPLASGDEEGIEDNGNPLASGRGDEDCWVHWLILVGMILTAVYFVGVAVRRRKFTADLLDYENKVLGNNRNDA